jgi:hypothetical protein
MHNVQISLAARQLMANAIWYLRSAMKEQSLSLAAFCLNRAVEIMNQAMMILTTAPESKSMSEPELAIRSARRNLKDCSRGGRFMPVQTA